MTVLLARSQTHCHSESFSKRWRGSTLVLRPVAHWAFGEGLEYLSDTEGGKGASLEFSKLGYQLLPQQKMGAGPSQNTDSRGFTVLCVFPIL